MLGLWITIAAIVGLLVGAVCVYLFLSSSAKNLVGQAKTEADRLRETAQKEAQTRAKEIEVTARREQVRLKQEFYK